MDAAVRERADWPVHQPAAPDAPIPGRHWYSGCDESNPRVRPDGVCEGCGQQACPECGREDCPDHGAAVSPAESGHGLVRLPGSARGEAGQGNLTQCERILEILADGREHSHHDFYGFCVLHSRISELRKRGHQIETRRDGDTYEYRLVSRATSSTDTDASGTDAPAPVEEHGGPIAEVPGSSPGSRFSPDAAADAVPSPAAAAPADNNDELRDAVADDLNRLRANRERALDGTLVNSERRREYLQVSDRLIAQTEQQLSLLTTGETA